MAKNFFTEFPEMPNATFRAMKKGIELVLRGESSRGTITNDTYTLKGFTVAINKLNKVC